MENKSKLNTVLLIIIIILLGVGLTYIFLNNNSKQKVGDTSSLNNLPQDNQNTVSQVPVTQNNTSQTTTVTTTTNQQQATLSNWKTYTNTQYGFSFQYPDTWTKNGEDAKVTDLQGNITEVDVNFINSISRSSLLVAYHLPPNGSELYGYAVSQLNASQGNYATAKRIKVAGYSAIEANNIFSVNGKGTPVPPIHSIIVDFLDVQQTGEFEFQFTTSATNDTVEVSNFNQLLSSFKFTN